MLAQGEAHGRDSSSEQVRGPVQTGDINICRVHSMTIAAADQEFMDLVNRSVP